MAMPTEAEFLDFAPDRLGQWEGVTDTFTLAAARLVSPDDGSTLLVIVSTSPAAWDASTDERRSARRTLEHMASIRWDEFTEWAGDGVLALDLSGRQAEPPKGDWGEDQAIRVVAPFPRPDETPRATAVAHRVEVALTSPPCAQKAVPRVDS
jgi:hypothetical protein